MEICNNSHKKELLKAIEHKAGENCFLYGDLENFDLESDFIDVWRIVKEGKTTSILLRYFKYYVAYSENDLDIPKMAKIIESDTDCTGISCLNSTLEKFEKFLNFKTIKKMFLAELSGESYKPVKINLTPNKATVDDLDRLFEFEKTIEEFNITEASRDSFGQEVRTGTGRIYYIEDEGNIVSTAGLTVENSKNGMIIGVATNPNYRRKGYAKSCVGAICSQMIEEGKTVLLFYDNPDAGVLYKNLGFEDINRWTMGTF